MQARVKKAGDLAAIEQQIEATAAQFTEVPVDAKKLDDLKRHLRYEFAQSLSNSESIAGTVAQYVALRRTPETINRFYDLYAKLTPEDIQRVARKYLTDKNRTVVTLLRVEIGGDLIALHIMGKDPQKAGGQKIIPTHLFENDDAQYAVHDHRSDSALIQAAGAALTTGVSGPELWAATWIWVNEGGDPLPLLPLLTNADASIRIMAATGLIARGRVEGFAPLIDELNDPSILVGQEPPTTAWAAATTSLVRFTAIADNGPPFDADASRRVVAQQRWRDWLAANQASLTFDGEKGLWHTA